MNTQSITYNCTHSIDKNNDFSQTDCFEIQSDFLSLIYLSWAIFGCTGFAAVYQSCDS